MRITETNKDDWCLLEFGPFQFDPESLELFRNGERIPLAPKPSRALGLLIARAGRVVRREEFVSALWPDEIVSYDKSLNFTLLQIRRALDDDAQHPSYVETVPRFGYRFIADLTERTTRQFRRRVIVESSGWRSMFRRRQWLGAALVVLLISIVFGPYSLTENRSPSSSPEARAHYVRGLDLLAGAELSASHRNELIPRAIESLGEAARLEPDNADYWLALANARFRTRLEREELHRASEAVQRVLELDPLSPGGHLRLGDVRSLLDWDWSGALEAYETALELDPQLAEVHRHLATHYLLFRDYEKAIEHTQTALRLEPVSSVVFGEAGWVYLYAGDYDSAILHCDRALELDPSSFHSRQCVLYASAWSGNEERAAREATRLLAEIGGRETDPNQPIDLESFHQSYLDFTDDKNDGLIEEALTLAALGRSDQALTNLERAVEMRMPQALFRIRDPRFSELSSSPRFVAILEDLDLEPSTMLMSLRAPSSMQSQAKDSTLCVNADEPEARGRSL